jgi:hypothetical protein
MPRGSYQQVCLMAGAAFRVQWNDIGVAVLCLPIDAAGKNPASYTAGGASHQLERDLIPMPACLYQMIVKTLAGFIAVLKQRQ